MPFPSRHTISSEKDRRLATELEAQGYTEQAPERNQKQYWCNTIKANAPANASAARPVKRATADKALAQFMERVKQVNHDPCFLYRVVKVVLFGSYLTDA